VSRQLIELSTPFPANLVRPAPQGKYGEYVPHPTVTERLLSIVGPFDFEVTEVIRGFAEEVKGKEKTYAFREDAIVGCLATMTAVIDGRHTTVTEVGSEDRPAMHNDAENLKNAASDALKRCAMRMGLGLHLWSGADYFLLKQLEKDEASEESATIADMGIEVGAKDAT
jgi:hypothetical protein